MDLMRAGSVAIVVLAVTFVACDSPTNCSCENGRDCVGRGPTVLLRAECFPLGTGLRCQAIRDEVGYCPGPNRDVTSASTWTSSNPQIASFNTGAPGILNVFAAGETRISATYEFNGSNVMTVFVSPDSAARQDTDIGIDVRREGTTLEGISDAQVDIVPEGATSQRCITDQRGYCRFQTRMTVAGSVDISVIKSGYAPATLHKTVLSRGVGFTVHLNQLGQ
jgi:hypothetical protein